MSVRDCPPPGGYFVRDRPGASTPGDGFSQPAGPGCGGRDLSPPPCERRRSPGARAVTSQPDRGPLVLPRGGGGLQRRASGQSHQDSRHRTLPADRVTLDGCRRFRVSATPNTPVLDHGAMKPWARRPRRVEAHAVGASSEEARPGGGGIRSPLRSESQARASANPGAGRKKAGPFFLAPLGGVCYINFLVVSRVTHLRRFQTSEVSVWASAKRCETSACPRPPLSRVLCLSGPDGKSRSGEFRGWATVRPH